VAHHKVSEKRGSYGSQYSERLQEKGRVRALQSKELVQGAAERTLTHRKMGLNTEINCAENIQKSGV
jgi:hypothetical protein